MDVREVFTIDGRRFRMLTEDLRLAERVCPERAGAYAGQRKNDRCDGKAYRASGVFLP